MTETKTLQISELIGADRWNEAIQLVNEELATGDVSEDLMILAATIMQHFGMIDAAKNMIEKGLKYSHACGELYYILGTILQEENPNQAYLCYENAAYHAANDDDRAYFISCMEQLKESGLVTVKPCSIVILTYNHLDVTIRCLDSIRQTCAPSAYEIVVVDNASSDDTPKYLKQQTDIRVLLNDENKGFPIGCNQGAAIATEGYDIFLLNNDTVMMPNALFTLRMGLYSADNVGSAGAITNYAANNQVYPLNATSVEEYRKYAILLNQPKDYSLEEKTWLVGFALITKRRLWEELEGLDERFTPGNSEDADLGLKMMHHGYKNVLCHNCFIYHEGSKSFGERPQAYQELLIRNHKLLCEKWGLDTGSEMFPRHEFLTIIKAEDSEPIQVLEIGCELSATLRRIKFKWPRSKVCGIEYRKDFVAIASPTLEVVQCDEKDTSLKYETQMFDYVICPDFHRNREKINEMLQEIKSYLKADGYVLASIDKGLKGLFNKKEILALFIKNGYVVDEYIAWEQHLVRAYVKKA